MSASSSPAAGRPRVVIVGAGFGGLACARALRDAPVDTVLVDQRNFHTFTPFLYQVVTALLERPEVAQPIRALLREVPDAEFRLGRASGVDFDGRVVHTDRGELRSTARARAASSSSWRPPRVSWRLRRSGW